ncbi:SigE family RNA polymerase sigma factor [Amycolatopsis mongoliensis]|uniref:SigE family RNA polymerase sigma factor n=1 Tax=Amycolatopsis mongoliensis TaxID=715475 RepID=A0A9Y2JT41_9PSEU|nr:SigE family RNA polymerase sigma factor [Amycolatopsis sp. 4-36]WIY04226.1 SigE family RNA polymerase sigma factor [Amycolatopsis sp. 4-36]
MARGDEEFADFVRASSARLTHAAYLLTGDRHQAEDAAQTAFTRTYAAWSRVRHKDAYGYARTVLVNHVIDGWRRPIREYATEAVPDRQDRFDVDKAVTQRAWLTAVLRTLTDRERAVVVLRHFFDLPEADVARELGVSLGTVKSTNSRALAKLRVEAGTEDTLIGGNGR